MLGDNEDYLTSIRRFYQRSSIVSALTPLSLFVKIDPIAAGIKEPGPKVKEIAQLCLENGIDGIIIDNQLPESTASD